MRALLTIPVAVYYLVHIRSGAPEQVGSVSAIVHEAVGFRIF